MVAQRGVLRVRSIVPLRVLLEASIPTVAREPLSHPHHRYLSARARLAMHSLWSAPGGIRATPGARGAWGARGGMRALEAWVVPGAQAAPNTTTHHQPTARMSGQVSRLVRPRWQIFGHREEPYTRNLTAILGKERGRGREEVGGGARRRAASRMAIRSHLIVLGRSVRAGLGGWSVRVMGGWGDGRSERVYAYPQLSSPLSPLIPPTLIPRPLLAPYSPLPSPSPIGP